MRLLPVLAAILLAVSCDANDGPPKPPPGPSAEELSTALGVRVEAIPGEVRQYLVHGRPGRVDFSKIGAVHENVGYSVGVTLPDGMEIGFRFTGPTADELGQILGVRVEAIPNEPRQYLVYASRGAVDFSKIGHVHTDVGYSVGVTLNDGIQVGFRFAGPSAEEISGLLGVEVEEVPHETRQYLVHARRAEVDLAKVGVINNDAGDNVGVTISDGMQIGLRFTGPSAAELSRLLGVKVTVVRGEFRQYLVSAAQGSVDFSRIGTVHNDAGMNVGVTLRDGTQVGFRYRSPAAVQEPK